MTQISLAPALDVSNVIVKEGEKGGETNAFDKEWSTNPAMR